MLAAGLGFSLKDSEGTAEAALGNREGKSETGRRVDGTKTGRAVEGISVGDSTGDPTGEKAYGIAGDDPDPPNTLGSAEGNSEMLGFSLFCVLGPLERIPEGTTDCALGETPNTGLGCSLVDSDGEILEAVLGSALVDSDGAADFALGGAEGASETVG